MSNTVLPMNLNQMSSALVYSCGEDVLETKIDEEIVLMSLGKGEYFSLDEVGSRIWELLKSKPLDIDSLCRALQEEYEINSATCRSETQAFLTTMVGNMLIEAVQK